MKVRSPDGREFSFYSREEFRLAIRRGGITAEWSVLHTAAGRWLPVTEHPVFRAQHDVHETVRRSNATEITATPGSECDHVSVIGTPEQDKSAPAQGAVSDRANPAIPPRSARFFLVPRMQPSLVIPNLLLLFRAVGVMGTFRYSGRYQKRHLSSAQAEGSQPPPAQ
jgi:hypothetical protein